jgi:ribosomal-protein-alanine N-acetyltransferase
VTAIRSASLADAAPMARLHAACFNDAWGEAAFRALMERPGAVAFLAGEDGFILAQAAADEAEILTLGVIPPARRRGLARALVEAAAAGVCERGAGMFFLEVAADNAAACALYRGVGFREAGIRPNYYGERRKPAVDALLLRRPLPL